MNLRPIRPDQPARHETRWSYQHHKDNFMGWVNSLGVERTLAGRIAHQLDERFRVRAIAYLFLFTLALSFLLSFESDISFKDTHYREGDLVSGSDIRSPFNFEFIDHDQTQLKKQQAEDAIPLVLDFDSSLYDEKAKRISRAFDQMRKTLDKAKAPLKKRDSFFLTQLPDFENLLGGTRISERTFVWLSENRFKPALEKFLIDTIRPLGEKRIISDMQELKEGRPDQIIINILEPDGKGVGVPVSVSTVVDVTSLRKGLVSDAPQFNQFGAEGSQAMAELSRALITPTLTLNKQETSLRKQRARESVAPSIVRLKKSNTIVKEGALIQYHHVRILDEIKRLQTSHHRDLMAFVRAVFFTGLLLSLIAFLRRFTPHVKINFKDCAAMAAILMVAVAAAKFFMFLVSAAFLERFPQVPASFYYFLMPVSASAMTVALLVTQGELVWIFTLFMSIVMGLFWEGPFAFALATVFATSLVGARGVRVCRKREDLYWVGLKVGLLNAILIFCTTLISDSDFSDLTGLLFWNTFGGFLSGLLSAFFTLTFIPLWENIFNYTTDLKLLELSHSDHPILRELQLKAPGTWYHSQVVGSMCEAAAESIGANPVLARVTSYYHDIGKMAHAQYFIENQRPGENKHDQISPGMSKTILIAHVKDGVEMGIHAKLGRSIVDVVEQHHGTTLISFFYQRAKEQEDPTIHEVSEQEYRYPGPRPQFKEAALCMLADSIEAAARSLDEPTPARLQSIVRNIVQKKFLDGQLNECDLTLRDLTTIEEAFQRVLLSIYHHRIDYPTGHTATKPVGSTPASGVVKP